MRRLLLLTRHAESGWDGAPANDHDRTLTARGQRQADRLGARLLQQQLAPEVIISSTAVRADETAGRVRRALPTTPIVQRVQALYQGGMAALRDAVEPLPNHVGAIMVVGHNPAMSAVASRLAGRPLSLHTATCVALRCAADSWQEAFDAPWQLLSVHHADTPSQEEA
ncbi:MAG TPA: hypothetical protein ENK23_01625 [Sorangium sp.]|nr:hypothetical protein [Sorangium sp.]